MSRTASRLPVVVGLGLTLSLFGGCATFNQEGKGKESNTWSLKRFWKKEYQKPQSLAAIWAPDTLNVPGQVATRGFGGRIYFYNEKSQAIPIEGELVVHGYLESKDKKGSMEGVQADKVFRFTAEQMSGHFSPSELGASYSVWIPWDAADGVRQELTLIPTFKAVDGSIVQGAPAKVNLPGRAPEGEKNHSPMQHVSYQRRTIPTNDGTALDKSIEPKSSKRMTTTTIRIPPASSIGQTRQSFTLNADQTNSTPSTPSFDSTGGTSPKEGFSVGGAGANTQHNVLPQFPSLPNREPFRQDLGLPQLPAAGLQPANASDAKPVATTGSGSNSSFQLTPWNVRNEQVQRASFQSQSR